MRIELKIKCMMLKDVSDDLLEVIIDHETENYTSAKRLGNPFDHRNYIVLPGYLVMDSMHTDILSDTPMNWQEMPKVLLIGHNIKYDLLYELQHNNTFWLYCLTNKPLIWDTQYFEYLKNGKQREHQMMPLKGERSVSSLYQIEHSGKIDFTGLTSDISKDKLKEYSIEDLKVTKEVYLKQKEYALKHKEFSKLFKEYQGSLLATIFMEYFGIPIYQDKLLETRDLLRTEADKLKRSLMKHFTDYLSSSSLELPAGVNINLRSKTMISAWLFGGHIPYPVRTPRLDKLGNPLRKLETHTLPVVNGVPTKPYKGVELVQDRYKNNKLKTKKVRLKTGDIRYRTEDRLFRLPGFLRPEKKNKTLVSDRAGWPIYKVGREELQEYRGVPFLDTLLDYYDNQKLLNTYYGSKEDDTGILPLIQEGKIRPQINHTSTVTGRFTSKAPNCQNIPRKGNSAVKKLFGKKHWCIMELDFSQLEIMIQAILTKDPKLNQEIIKGTDFHTKRMAMQYNLSYQKALSLKETPIWAERRNQCKGFSFKRSYGAGVNSISLTTGLTPEQVRNLIQKENQEYPKIKEFEDACTKRISFDPLLDIKGNRTLFKKYYSDYKHRMEFSRPQILNYPIQSNAARVLCFTLNKLIYHLLDHQFYQNKLFLVNSVYDSLWFLVHPSIKHRMPQFIKIVQAFANQCFPEKQIEFKLDGKIGDDLYDTSPV